MLLPCTVTTLIVNMQHNWLPSTHNDYHSDRALNKLLVKQDLARPLLTFAASPTSIRSANDWSKANT